MTRKRSSSENTASEQFLPKRRYALRNQQQIDYIALNEGDDKKLKHVHPHTDAFLACFDTYKNTTSALASKDFNRDFFEVNRPVKILDPENSGMEVPKPKDLGFSDHERSLTVDDITRILGDDYPVDVMDVQTQQNERWSMSRWNDYFSKTSPQDRDRIRNVISLEVSQVQNLKIKRPEGVEENDLVNVVWNSFGNRDPKPQVTRYVLMSGANSYTDFHLDFAGTSVYYNLISGNKKFILFPPTENNLRIYADWCSSSDQNLIFLGDLLEDGIALDLQAGDLFMISSGYIHAVYTPEDSLIIGGNFLTLRDIETQLEIVNLEKVTKVPKKFTFPQFDSVMGKCCEWVLSHPTDKEKKIEEGMLPITRKSVKALIQYMEQSSTKYKPLNYSSKRAMIKRLHEYVE